jgi:AraC-like DNA-binding protein
MRFLKNKSVLIHYLVSYILIVFLASFFLGILIFIFSINRILEANVHVAQTKLDFISSDLETQFDIMQDIVYDIRIGLYYKPAYFLRNKYYETELLENFSKYGAYSPLIDEYFLYYRESSLLYRGSGSTIDPRVFIENIIGGRDPDIWPRVESITGNEVLVVSHGDKNLFFFLFPVSVISSYQDVYSNEALVGFVFEEGTLKRRISALAGMTKPLFLYYRDMPLIRLFGESEGMDFSLSFKDQLAAKNIKKLVFSRSPEGSFQIIMSRENIEGNILVQNYRNTLVLAIGIIVVVLCFAGIYMAYMNYRPIKNLETSIGDTALPKKAGYEFETITEVFKKLKEEESRNHRIIQGQLNGLRRQMADIILGGGYNSGVQSKSWEMGIVLEGPWFGIAALRVDRNSSPIDETGLWEILENITISGAAIYCGNLSADSSFSILLDYFNEPSARDSAARSLYGKCADRGLRVSIGVGPVIKNLSRISDALLEAHKALQESMVSGEGIVFCEEIPGYPGGPRNSESWTEDFARALKRRELSGVAAALDGLAPALAARNRSVIYHRSVYYHLLSVMVNIAREIKFSIQQEWISNILKSTSPEDFRKNMLVIAEQLCASEPANTNGTIVRPIMDYIRAHSCDYSMSLEMLREQFGYSITQLSHMIKDFSGESFRTYVTALRMEKARELLKTDMTVAEISGMVGYGSVSHFIKTFRSHFGNKPSSFRNQPD